MSTKHAASCDCGWSGTYTSDAKAAHALRRHSCEKQAVVTARAERVAARKAADGPKRDCRCKVARHEHGTPNAYVVDKCRCRPCREANNVRRQRQNKNRAYGRAPYVDAGPARGHIEHLQAQGMGWKRAARAAGLNESVVWKLLYGDPSRDMAPSKRILPKTEAAILAVTLDLAGVTSVDSTGTRRRVQALHTLGWGIEALARETGVDRQALDQAMRGRDVRASTHRAVADAYERLWETPAPTSTKGERIAASRARKRAVERQWVAPLAWDDIDTDETPAVDEVDTRRRMGRRPVVDVDSLTDCAGWGMTTRQAADRLGVSVSAVENGMRRHAPHLRGRFERNALAHDYREVAS